MLDIITHLEDEGFEVYEAPNADIAIDILKAHPDIKVIFTDIDMPGTMDGLKLAAAVRDRWPPVKIVVTSGRHIISTAEMPDGSIFFKKPYDHAKVAAAFRVLLAT